MVCRGHTMCINWSCSRQFFQTVCFLGSWLAAAPRGAVPAEPVEFDAATKAYLDGFVTYQNHLAEANIHKRQGERLESATQRNSPTLVAALVAVDDVPLKQSLLNVLHGNHDALVQALRKAAEEGKARQQDLVQQWHDVRSECAAEQMKLLEVKGQQQTAGQLAFLLSVDNRWFWLFGLIAVSTLSLMVLHDRRHELRRWLNGGRPRAMGLATVLNLALLLVLAATLATFFYGDRIYQSLLKSGTPAGSLPLAQLREESQAVAQNCREADDAAKQSRSRYQTALTGWKEKLTAGGTDPATVQLLQETWNLVGTIAAATAVQKALLDQLDVDRAALDRVDQELLDSAVRRLRPATAGGSGSAGFSGRGFSGWSLRGGGL